MPRFAANLSTMFQEWTFLDRFAAAADAGFAAVECQFPYAWSADDVAARVARNNLSLVMFNIAPGDLAAGERGFAALPERFAAVQASVREALSYAQATGTKKLHLLAGVANRHDPHAVAAFRHAVAWSAETAARDGVVLLIEPINDRDMPGYFLGDFDFAEQVVGDIGSANLKLQFDIYHRQILHGDVMVALRRMLPIIGHVQVASVPGRHEPETGELSDFRIFRELDRLGYTGFVGCEYLPQATTLGGLGWIAGWHSAQPG